uniref:Uncharacterized protein n=1 Tax=Globodera pallida TaxID=36090 RepID=A0A183CIL5_GLOPA
MPTTGAGAGQSGQPPKKRVLQFRNDAILVQTRRYEPNPAEWTAFDAQSQQPQRQMIRGGNNIRAEHAQKGKETAAAAAAGWHLISVDGAVQHVEPELVPAGDDDEQMRPTAAAFVESAAGAADEVSGEDQPIETGTNHRSLDDAGDQCQQLLSDIRALLGVPEMSAEETANALERCGTKTPREICAEMLQMLEAPLGSEMSDSEHSKEKRPVDGEKAAAPAATNSSDILHSSEAEEATEEATNLVVTRREVEAVQQAEEEEETHEDDAEVDQNEEEDDEEEEVEAVQQAEEEEETHKDDSEEDQNGEDDDEDEEEVEAVQQAEEEEETHEDDSEEEQNGEDDEEDEEEEEEEESLLPPGLFDDASSGEENADQVGQKRASPKLPRPAIGFGLHPYRVGAARFDHQSRTEEFQKWKEASATMTPLERWQKAKRGILHRVIM